MVFEERDPFIFLLAIAAEIFLPSSAAAPPVETVPAAIRTKFAMQNGHMAATPYCTEAERELDDSARDLMPDSIWAQPVETFLR